jgi:lipopolysaccharide/colanic/teichoic acid biosynthesis glycosyltransferase
MRELTIPMKNHSGINSLGSESNGNFLVQFSGTLDPFFVRKIPAWKRLMDIFGSILGLILFAPIFLLITLIIKVISPGPVFFKQERIGFRGKKFTFIKYRTMKINCDTSAHRQYYARLINGCKNADNSAECMLKLDTHDSQIIPFGKLLRKTCLDELPQLVNVLRGEMSLVGPRPPIPYEVAEYSRWHNGRFDTVPGMTGLWQVSGKNKLTFKEMVRLDIHYSRNLSFIDDVKILIRTPVAILSEIIESLQTKIMHRSNGSGFNVPG